MGLLGRPQTFWPMRRSILYFASWRLVIASSFAAGFEDRALLCPGLCHAGTDRFLAEAPAIKTAGRETPREPKGPRNARFLGGKGGEVKSRNGRAEAETRERRL